MGKKKVVWKKIPDLSKDPVIHPPFDEETRDVIRQLQETFAEVSPGTLEEWENSFRQDANPQSEIALWQRMGVVYLHFTQGLDLGQQEKEDIFGVVLACGTVLMQLGSTLPEAVLATVRQHGLVILSLKRVKEITDYWITFVEDSNRSYPTQGS
jgi:hypothetical protein